MPQILAPWIPVSTHICVTLAGGQHPSTFLWLAWRLSHVQLFMSLLDWSLPGFSTHGVFQARVLEQVAISFSRGSSWPRDWTPVPCVSCVAGGFFTTELQERFLQAGSKEGHCNLVKSLWQKWCSSIWRQIPLWRKMTLWVASGFWSFESRQSEDM